MLDFLYTAVSWVLLRWHQLMTLIGLDASGGANWVLSIVLLVITARVILFRFFIKQVHYQRRMAELQPKMQQLRERYKNDKAELNRQMMKFQQDEGFNPISGCLPLVLQLPVFIGLYHTLRHLASASQPGYPVKNLTLYGFTAQQTRDGANARIFGAPLSATFKDHSDVIQRLGGNPADTRTVIVVLVLISAFATFMTQRVTQRNAPTAPVGQAAAIQKVMLYLFPLGVVIFGLFFNFPLGIAVYYFTTNIWTFGQQLYIQRFHPHTPKDAPVAGEVGRTLRPQAGARPVVDGRSSTTGVKPRPGAKPDQNGTAATKQGASDKKDDADEQSNASAPKPETSRSESEPLPARVPRPGARPNNRSGGSRPSGNRPSKAKKRR